MHELNTVCNKKNSCSRNQTSNIVQFIFQGLTFDLPSTYFWNILNDRNDKFKRATCSVTLVEAFASLLTSPSASCWDKLTFLHSPCSRPPSSFVLCYLKVRKVSHTGQKWQEQPDIFAPGQTAVYGSLHELTTTAAGSPPCRCCALLCSSSEPCSAPHVMSRVWVWSKKQEVPPLFCWLF